MKRYSTKYNTEKYGEYGIIRTFARQNKTKHTIILILTYYEDKQIMYDSCNCCSAYGQLCQQKGPSCCSKQVGNMPERQQQSAGWIGQVPSSEQGSGKPDGIKECYYHRDEGRDESHAANPG